MIYDCTPNDINRIKIYYLEKNRKTASKLFTDVTEPYRFWSLVDRYRILSNVETLIKPLILFDVTLLYFQLNWIKSILSSV